LAHLLLVHVQHLGCPLLMEAQGILHAPGRQHALVQLSPQQRVLPHEPASRAGHTGSTPMQCRRVALPARPHTGTAAHTGSSQRYLKVAGCLLDTIRASAGGRAMNRGCRRSWAGEMAV